MAKKNHNFLSDRWTVFKFLQKFLEIIFLKIAISTLTIKYLNFKKYNFKSLVLADL